MPDYMIKGVIQPERALLSIGAMPTAKLTHAGTGILLTVDLSIIVNQVSAWVTTDVEWDIKDLRNTVRYYVNSVVFCIAFARGLAYELDIRQISSRALGIDYVYGIDVPCINGRHPTEPEASAMQAQAMAKITGGHGVTINRCLQDLKMALSHSEDTAFYCYRGIESLRQYCGQRYGTADETKQWAKLSQLSGYQSDYIAQIKKWAAEERHGNPQHYSAKENEEMLTRTWNIVEAFLKNAH